MITLLAIFIILILLFPKRTEDNEKTVIVEPLTEPEENNGALSWDVEYKENYFITKLRDDNEPKKPP